MAEQPSSQVRHPTLPYTALSQSKLHEHGAFDAAQGNGRSWRALLMITIAFTAGLGCAISHHFMGVRLHLRPVESISLSQAWISRFSTALAFLVKTALVISIGAAYTQRQWRGLSQQSFKTSDVDALTGVLGNIFNFFSSTIWFRHPVLTIVALVSWGIPLATIVAPGSLTVLPVYDEHPEMLPVPQPQFNFTHFGSASVSANTLADFRTPKNFQVYSNIYRLAYQAASSAQPVPIEAAHQNETYHLRFLGPAARCAAASDDSLLYNISVTARSPGMVFSYMSWVLPAEMIFGPVPDDVQDLGSDLMYGYVLDSWSKDAARIFIMTNNGDDDVTVGDRTNDTKFDHSELSGPLVNLTECLLYNATYDVDFSFRFPRQSRQVSISAWHNTISIQNLTESPTEPQDRTAASYLAIMDAFGKLLVGYQMLDVFSGLTTARTAFPIMSIDWNGGEAAARGLEQLFQNITLSVLSEGGLTKNFTSAELIPVLVETWPITYFYARSDLLIPYGVSLLCTLVCAIIGLHAFFANHASYQNIFSTFLRATNDLDIRSRIRSGDTGCDPLPEDLKQSEVRFSDKAQCVVDDAEHSIAVRSAGRTSLESGQSVAPEPLEEEDPQSDDDASEHSSNAIQRSSRTDDNAVSSGLSQLNGDAQRL